jgi:hypothetical protein
MEFPSNLPPSKLFFFAAISLPTLLFHLVRIGDTPTDTPRMLRASVHQCPEHDDQPAHPKLSMNNAPVSLLSIQTSPEVLNQMTSTSSRIMTEKISIAG